MPKLNKRLPAYRHHKSSGRGVVSLGGRKIYLPGRYNSKKSLEAYDREVEEYLRRGRAAPHPADASPSVAEICAAYLRHVKEYYATDPKMLDHEKRMIGRVKKLYAETSAIEFGPVALKTLRKKLVDDPQRNLSRGYINRTVTRVKRMFKWAASEELIPATVHQALDTVEGLRQGHTTARETEPVTCVPDADIEATLPYLMPTVRDMVRFQRLTGCRPGELVIMRPADIDRTDSEVWNYKPHRHKTQTRGKLRTIAIGPQAQQILLPRLLRPSNAPVFSPQDAVRERRQRDHESRKTPMGCGNQPGDRPKRNGKRDAGQAYTVDSYRRAVHLAARMAGVPLWNPNRLRHTAATEIRSKYGLDAAQVVCGHSNAKITQVYAEADRSVASKVAREIG